MKVRDVFESLPGVGPQRANQLMAKFKIAEAKRIGGLGARQRVEVIRHFS
jgi:ribosomal protein S13